MGTKDTPAVIDFILKTTGADKVNYIGAALGDKAKGLVGEGNLYHPLGCNKKVKKSGISQHGDEERRLVAAVRLGRDNNLFFQWYVDGKAVEDACFHTVLRHGDMYVMSEKAVGTDWKNKKVPTLRHSAGIDVHRKSYHPPLRRVWVG